MAGCYVEGKKGWVLHFAIEKIFTGEAEIEGRVVGNMCINICFGVYGMVSFFDFSDGC